MAGGPSQNWGLHPDPRRRSRHSRGEKYVLAGGAGQNMISFSFPACGRGNSARRALPGESVGRKGRWGPLGLFCGLPPGPAALPGESVGRKGIGYPIGGFPTPKAFPSGGRCPSAHTGADEGAIPYPTFPCRKGTIYRLSPQRHFSFAPLGNPVAPSSVTSGDSFPPRGSLRRWYTPATKCFRTQLPLPQNVNPNQGTYMGPVIAPQSPRCAPPRQNERVATSGP